MFTEYVSSKKDKGGQVDVIYTDFLKAFDRIDHFIILNKLNSLGFYNSPVQLLSSYLSDQEQYVNKSKFYWYNLCYKDAILGPILPSIH